MGIKDIWRKYKNRQIAKKDEKLVKALQNLNIDPEDLIGKDPIAVVEFRDAEIDSSLLTRFSHVERKLEDFRQRNDDLREKFVLDGQSKEEPSTSRSDTSMVNISKISVQTDLLNSSEEEAKAEAEAEAEYPLDDPELKGQRKREQEMSDEEFARRLQLEIDEEEAFTYANFRQQRETEIKAKEAVQRQIDRDEALAWRIHLRGEDQTAQTDQRLSSEEICDGLNLPRTSSIQPPLPMPMELSQQSRREIPEFVRKANEIQRRRSENSAIKTRGDRIDPNRPRAGEINSQQNDHDPTENDAALARALQDAENEFFEQHIGPARHRTSTETNEQLERFVDLIPMLLSDGELNEESDDEEGDGQRETETERKTGNGQNKNADVGRCNICLEDGATDPVACAQCKQLIGCRRCVLNWYRGGTSDDFNTVLWFLVAGDENYKRCPLCRHRWLNQPELIEIRELQEI